MKYIKFFWRFPKITVFFIMVVEIMLYFDRGVIASLLPHVKSNWGLNSIEEGAIASVFTIGFMCASPMWAHFGLRYRINKVIALGTLIFALGAFSSGFWLSITRGRIQKWAYYPFVISRFMVGFGESAMISLAYTIVDELAPPEYKTLYMAAIMMSPSLGIASGYGFCGVLVDLTRNWQIIFYLESAVALTMAYLCLYTPFHGYKRLLLKQAKAPAVEFPSVALPDITMPHQEEAVSELSESTSIISHKDKPIIHSVTSAIPPLVKNPVYLSIVAVSVIYGAIVGALTFWCPTYLQERLSVYDISEANINKLSNLGFGAIVFISSVFGTALGALVLDKSGGAVGWRGVMRAMYQSFLYISIALPFGFVVFIIRDGALLNVYGLFALFLIAMFFVLCIAAPFQVALNNCVPPELRHFANAYQTFLLHALGDFPSPTIFGFIKQFSNITVSMLVMWGMLIPGLCFLLLAGTLSLYNDRRNKPIK
ncbi:sphingolipid transporter SPNS1 [Acrasis kona]|uniref:Sphingolipid transporter SPNS1 n=1 Tax=Acrasis kona TaxID=1008807 RepID=A0AAW2ZCK0_9EUKA